MTKIHLYPYDKVRVQLKTSTYGEKILMISFWIYMALTIFLTVTAIITGGFFLFVIGAVSGGFMTGVIVEHRYGRRESS